MRANVIYIISILLFFSWQFSFGQKDVKGYRIDGDDVVFTFDVRDYRKATSDEEGRKRLKDIDIKNVVVSGEFNDWSKYNWNMTQTDYYTYEFRKKIIDFTDAFSWEFKFVVNNDFWVEPSNDIQNIAPARSRSGAKLNVYNLRLFTAHPSENGNASFKLKGYENAKKVILAGSFNKWNEDAFGMKKANDGWEITLQLNPGVYEYRFIVDGNWMEDPNNPSRIINEHGGYNSVISILQMTKFILNGYKDAKNVILAGEFNDWSETEQVMTQTHTGWECSLLLPGGKHHYKYIVDGNWILDPDNPVTEYDGKGHVNSVCMVK